MKRLIFFAAVIAFCSLGIPASKKPTHDYPTRPVPFTEVTIEDDFWAPRLETNRTVTIPFAFKKCEETGRIDNFSIAGGLMEGKYRGKRYNDSDVYKIMEGAAYSLRVKPDPELERSMDELIQKIAAAQEEDGYLFAARTVDSKNPPPGAGAERWSLLVSSHELYNVGHMYEAAVAYYQATGKKKFLEVAIKNANLIDSVFGPGKRLGYPGHQEIEIGLVKLFRTTGEEKYLNLAKFFLDIRGRIPWERRFPAHSPFAIYNEDWYLQAHKPVLDQAEAVGHAVRASYMYSGMADVAALTGDPDYLAALDRIWKNVVGKKIYLTGGIGSRGEGEAFGDDYELPNATGYCETCAAIGNVFWNERLFLLHGDAKYIDVLERTLYNGLISGISQSGDRFFYSNPLESDGKSGFNQGQPTRQPWFEVACCPGNLARFVPSIPGYVYAAGEDVLYINLFVANSGFIDLGENRVKITQQTRYPWDGKMNIIVEPARESEFTVAVRVPGWARNEPLPSDLYVYQKTTEERATLKVNGKSQALDLDRGYVKLRRRWKRGDLIELDLPMRVQRVTAHPSVKNALGKVAVERGPLVYCFEGVDNDRRVLDRSLAEDWSFALDFREDLLGGLMVIAAKGRDARQPLVAIPYYAWCHRGAGEMAVWLARTPHRP